VLNLLSSTERNQAVHDFIQALACSATLATNKSQGKTTLVAKHDFNLLPPRKKCLLE
jgi:hypothetical protein